MSNPRQILHMCDFCIKEFDTCQANYVQAKEFPDILGTQDAGEKIIACDKYESPVELLKNKFHDYS